MFHHRLSYHWPHFWLHSDRGWRYCPILRMFFWIQSPLCILVRIVLISLLLTHIHFWPILMCCLPPTLSAGGGGLTDVVLGAMFWATHAQGSMGIVIPLPKMCSPWNYRRCWSASGHGGSKCRLLNSMCIQAVPHPLPHHRCTGHLFAGVRFKLMLWLQGGVNAAIGNASNDDWRWHMYDTVKVLPTQWPLQWAC